ncbi:MAG: NAD(P)-dependent oxidoreductase [Solirubrobacterales bacterium]|nr:NAD(P)-dependent oxidoreductase [Solirubrobacterales bacterium]
MSADMKQTCGVLGVGSLGAGIAERLAEQGFAVHAHDLDPARVEALAPFGITAAATPRELAAACDVILLLLPDTPEILACLDGEDGLEAGLAEGASVLVASTVLPATPQALAARLAPLGVGILDTPVSGGPVVARQGELAIMVGADPEAYARCRNVLETMGRPVHVGPVGHGEIAKLANNLMGSVIAVGIAEGLALAAKAGADVDRVREAIDGGSGASWILSDWMPRTVLAGRTEADFAVRLMCKDMGLLETYAAEIGVPLRAGKLAQETFEEVRDRGYGDRDFSVLVALRAEETGATLLIQDAP